MNILPGILATTLNDLKEQLDKLSWAKKIHLDIMDGQFAPNKTIQARDLIGLFPESDVQVHLMAHKPHTYINKYAQLGAKEFIIHAEATDNHASVLEKIRQTGMKAGIAFNPPTNITPHQDSLAHSDIALVMTVNIGFSGQQLMKEPLKKIREIKHHNPAITIGVDGGFNKSTCGLVCNSGADFTVASSAVTGTVNPKLAYDELLTLCKK